MSDELERADTYYEVQVDRETLVLLALGVLAVVVAAFLVGRWTAPGSGDPAAAAPTAAAQPSPASESLAGSEPEDVDGEPLFGGTPVSVEGAPALTPVPTEPLPEPIEAASKAAASSPPPASPPSARAPVEGWVVQVSAVKSSRDADRLKRELEKKGWPVRVLRESGFSKVQVGPFAERSEADAAERRLKREERVSTWVKRS